MKEEKNLVLEFQLDNSLRNENSTDGAKTDNTLIIDVDFNVFFYTVMLSFIIYTSFALILAIKSKFKLDFKAWANLGVNIICFMTKGIFWTYIITKYGYHSLNNKDNPMEANGQIFLWDYLASFMTKMTIYAFIFEML